MLYNAQDHDKDIVHSELVCIRDDMEAIQAFVLRKKALDPELWRYVDLSKLKPRRTSRNYKYPFQGVWDDPDRNRWAGNAPESIRACDDYSDTRFEITETTMDGWETKCRFVRVKRLTPISWRVDMRCKSEGESYKQTLQFMVTDHSNASKKPRLVIYGREGASVHERCP